MPRSRFEQHEHRSIPVTQRLLERLLTEEVGTDEAPPYIPALEGNRAQPDLSALPLGDLAGKRVLDVGCNLGLRCFQALQAGAAEVVGVDVNPARILQARSLASRLQLPAEFRCADADRDPLPGRFDIVVCCGVLEHSRDPAALIDRLGEATGEALVLETEGPEGAHASRYLRELGMGWWERRVLRRFPLLLVGRNGPNPLRSEARFYFSEVSLRQLLRFHQSQFGDVRVAAATIPGRHVATVRRRKIGHLVVLAGASGAGKSTFIDRLHRDGVRKMLAPVGLDDLAEWEVVSASEYYGAPAEIDRLCLHYDMNRAVRYTTKAFDRDNALELIGAAERVTFLTMWTDPDVLIDRKIPQVPSRRALSRHRSYVRRLVRRVRRLGVHAVERDSQTRISTRQLWDLAFCSDPHALEALYDDWFRFCDEAGSARHYVVDMDGDVYSLSDAAAWRAQSHSSHHGAVLLEE